MRRRQFITGLGGAAAWPFAVRAQQQALPVVGFLNNSGPETRREHLVAFHKGLAETGYVEGHNVAIEYRWAEGRYERLPALAIELVRQNVATIATGGIAEAARAAQAATQTIPIIFLTGADPVAEKLVTNLARPSGNLTGITNFVSEVRQKRVELLRKLLPAGASISYVGNPRAADFSFEARDLLTTAGLLSLKLLILRASSPAEVEAAFAELMRHQTAGLVVSSDTFFITQRNQIVALAARYAIPTIFHYREAVEAGGLMSYGASQMDGMRQQGVYTGRILKGAKPADLPVLQPTRIELLINLKTAKALGLTIPEALLATADEVIQ
jgi:putative ABC transport system substrate-binding protein